MKAFLASLLAVAALAEEEDGTNYLISTDSEMLEWAGWDDSAEADYTNAGEELTLTTSDDGTDITFCFTPTDGAWAAASDIVAVFGVAWTDGVEYVAADGTETDAVVILANYDFMLAVWSYLIFDDIDEVDLEQATAGEGTESTVWTGSDATDWACVDTESCTGAICVQRALEAEEGEYDLPFASGTDFIAYYQFINF